MKKKMMIGLLSFISALTVAACGSSNDTEKGSEDKVKTEEHSEHSMHSGSEEIPEGLGEAEDPAFPKGSKAILKAGHMEGMKGAEAVISGAFDTTAYSVTYTPADGGEQVTGHKWVIHEELKDAGSEPLKTGDRAIMDADHMEGMKGAEAVIDSAVATTVYMVDFTPENGDKEIKNHKWVIEDELTKK